MNINAIPLYRFIIQIGVIVAALGFCGYGLLSGDRRNQGIYTNLGSLMLGYLFPSPGGGAKKEGDHIAIEGESHNVFPQGDK